MKHSDREEIHSLANATLEDLQTRFPDEWSRVGNALVAAAQTKRAESLVAFVNRFQTAAKPWEGRIASRRATGKALKAAMPHVAMAHMARLAARQALQATAARVAVGHDVANLRFGWWSGWLTQKLFFATGLQRKPVSLAAFRLLWPLIRQRRILMPLVTPKGIYCFYSRPLIAALAAHIGTRSCVEIAAGDGTLARFLNEVGCPVRATDDKSWAHAVTYAEHVEAMDATSALLAYRPRVVLCSFPPPNNTFEADVFKTPEVDMYIVLTTRHRFAAGNWDAYEIQGRQHRFDCEDDRQLARLLLPPEIDPAVLIFRRK